MTNQFDIVNGPSVTDLIFALFDRNHPRNLKFTIQGVSFGQKGMCHDAHRRAEEEIRREIFDENLPSSEIQIVVTGVDQSDKPDTWFVTGRIADGTFRLFRSTFSTATRKGSMLIG